MELLEDYINNLKTLLEIGKFDKVLFSDNSFVDKDIFMSEIKTVAERNIKISNNPTLNENQFLECIKNAKLKTIENTLEELVNLEVLKKVVTETGEIEYTINDEENFPEWLRDIIN